MPLPALADEAGSQPADSRRTKRGRRAMLLVLAVCAAPVLASYFAYFVVKPQARNNYGELITPPRELPDALPLLTLTGDPVRPASLRGQWLLVVVADAACDAGCERQLLLQRQLRETLGRDRERVDKLWLATGTAAPRADVLQAIGASSAGGATVLRADAGELARWLAPAAGQAPSDHLFVVDPMGRWMMRAPVDPEPARLKRDLERLLRASASWDTPGR